MLKPIYKFGQSQPETQPAISAAGTRTPTPASPAPGTLEAASQAFGRLCARDKQVFVKNILEGAAIGKKIASEEEFDAAIQAELDKRKAK